MRRTVSIPPDQGAQLLTDNASSYANGLTLINTSQTVTLYLGADSFVTSDDGVPLPPGMSVPWNTDNSALYACVRSDGGAGQIMLTDNIAPLTGQIPPTIVPDVWSFDGKQVNGTQTVTGTTTTAQLAGPSTAECLFNIVIGASSFGTNPLQLVLVSAVAGSSVSIASTAALAAGKVWQGVVDGIAVPYGGYTIGIKNTGTSGNLEVFGAGSDVTLVRQS